MFRNDYVALEQLENQVLVAQTPSQLENVNARIGHLQRSGLVLLETSLTKHFTAFASHLREWQQNVVRNMQRATRADNEFVLGSSSSARTRPEAPPPPPPPPREDGVTYRVVTARPSDVPTAVPSLMELTAQHNNGLNVSKSLMNLIIHFQRLLRTRQRHLPRVLSRAQVAQTIIRPETHSTTSTNAFACCARHNNDVDS